MRDWHQVTLGDVVTSHWSGYSFKSSDYTETGVPVLTKGDIKPRGVVVHGGKYISNASLSNGRIRLTDRRDLLVTTRDLTTAADFLGLVARAPRWARFAVNQGVTIFRVDEQRIDPQYLVYWCESPLFRGHIKGHYAGATQIHIRHADVMAAPVVLPAMQLQRRIASILSAYDDLIENNTRRIAILEEMTRRIYEEWFVRFRYPGHENVRMVESELGLVPEGWRIARLESVTTKIGSGATPRGGKSAYQDRGVTLIRSQNVYDYSFVDEGLVFLDADQAAALDGVAVARDDILLNITGASVARCCIVPPRHLPARVNQHVMILRADPLSISPHYLLMTINSASRKEQLLSIARTGSTREALTKETMSGFRICVPHASVLKAFTDAVGGAFRLQEVLAQQIGNLRITRDLLLPKLISGELDVSAMPEPEAIAA